MAVPTLDGLPTEIKILILSQVEDRDTLKSLVLASPGYHQAYLAVRRELLECLVKRQYCGFLELTEALTAVRSKGVHMLLNVGNVISLLDRWRRSNEIRELSQSPSNRVDEPNGLDEIIKLLLFHKMLSFFLEDFSINAPRPPWIEPNQWENEYLPLRLSVCEKRRLLRALCRLQIMKNIFGDPVHCFKYSCDSCWRAGWWVLAEKDELRAYETAHGPESIRQLAYRLFYGTMPVWEHDEMGSVFNYLIAKVKTVFDEIADDLRLLSKNTPCKWFCDILPEEQRLPSICTEVENEWDLDHFDNHYEGVAGLGPEYLYRALHMDWLSRRNDFCIQKRAAWQGPFIGLNVTFPIEGVFPFIDPADRYENRNFEQFWSTLPPLEQPTVGWKKARLLPHDEQAFLEDAYNYERQFEKDWEWCYAIYDERRLKEWKAPLLGEDGQGDEAAGST